MTIVTKCHGGGCHRDGSLLRESTLLPTSLVVPPSPARSLALSSPGPGPDSRPARLQLQDLRLLVPIDHSAHLWQVTYHKRRYEPCVDFFKTHCHEYYCILLSVEPTTDEKLVIRRELTTGREMAASDSASSASRTIPPPGPASDHAYPSGYASGPRARWFTALCTASSRSQLVTMWLNMR